MMLQKECAKMSVCALFLTANIAQTGNREQE